TVRADELVLPLPVFAQASGWVGHEIFPPSPDVVVRSLVPLVRVEGRPGAVPSASLLAWLRQRDRLPAQLVVADGGETLRIPDGPALSLAAGTLPLDFAPNGATLASVSARKVLDDDDPLALESALAGKLAIVGLENLYEGGERSFVIPHG